MVERQEIVLRSVGGFYVKDNLSCLIRRMINNVFECQVIVFIRVSDFYIKCDSFPRSLTIIVNSVVEC